MKRDLSDSQTTTGHTAEQQVDGAANRAAAKVRRYRERKRAGIVLAAVEIEPEVLDFLAWGTHTSVETLKANRPSSLTRSGPRSRSCCATFNAGASTRLIEECNRSRPKRGTTLPAWSAWAETKA
jgi:hypothetical protein